MREILEVLGHRGVLVGGRLQTDAHLLPRLTQRVLVLQPVELADVIPYTLDPEAIQEQAATIIGRLKVNGITSVIMASDPIAPKDFTQEATAQDYFPEWIISSTALVDTNAFARTYDQKQWAHADVTLTSSVF